MIIKFEIQAKYQPGNVIDNIPCLNLRFRGSRGNDVSKSKIPNL